MKEKLKRNYKLIVAFVIVVIIASGSVYAADTISSSNISYSNKDSKLTSENLQDAIDELNTKATTKIAEAKKECPDNYSCLIKPNNSCTVVSGTGNNIGDEIACNGEHFYVIESNLKDITMLTKYPVGETPPYGAPRQFTDTPADYHYKYVWDLKSTVEFSSSYFAMIFGYKASEYISSVQGLTITQLEKLGCSVARLSGDNYNDGPGGAEGTCVGSGKPWLYSFGDYMIEKTGPLANFIDESGRVTNHGRNLLLRPVVTIPVYFITEE